MNMRRVLLLAVLLIGFGLPGEAAEWCTGLYLGNGGFWSQRVRVSIANHSQSALSGFPVAIPIGAAEGQANLAGTAAEALRVCDASGAEMLWSLAAPDGDLVERGAIPSGATLTIPVECDAGGTADYFLYFDNPDAWGVPDFLPDHAGVVNPAVEQGQAGETSGWRRDPPDDAHQAIWSSEQPHAGRSCLQTIVAPGAEPTWIGTRQYGIPVLGGEEYRLTAWVRAENVEGWAGWFIHAGNQVQSQLLNRSLNAGDGTFGWKMVSDTFTIPPGADQLTIGTVLRGTGTAWYDDVRLECLGGKGISLQVGPVEQRQLQRIGAESAWPGGEQAAWTQRVPLRLTNADDAAITGQLWSVDLTRVLHRVRGTAGKQGLIVMDGNQRTPHALFGETLVFAADVPARSVRTCWAYFASDPVAPVPQESLGSRNLAANADFETKAPPATLPSHWTTQVAPGNKQGVVAALDSPGHASQQCVRLSVPKSDENQWHGWQQSVPVMPGETYLFGAWVRCEEITGGDVRLHGHVYNADGKLCQPGGYTSVGAPLTGTADWTWLWGTVRMPADAATYHLHLTMNASGTVWHDGVLLERIAPASAGDVETRASGTPGLHAWQVNPIVKVFRDDAPTDQSDQPVAAIQAARNEYEPVQLAVRSNVAVQGLRIHVDPPRHAGGAVLDQTDVGVVGYVPVDYPSSYYRAETPSWRRKIPASPPGCDGWSGWWPDPLLPTDQLDLEANQTQPVWVTVHVPPGAPAGEYRGAIRFVRQGADVLRVPLTVDVWDFDLPDETHLKAIYDVRFRTPWWTGGPAARERVGEQLWRMLAQHRLSAHEVHPAPTFAYRDGAATADFTEFDRAATHYFDELGMTHAYTPWHFYGFGWGHPPRDLFGIHPFAGEFPYEQADRTQLNPEWKRAYQACLKLFWDHVQIKGWADRITLYISDEPHYYRHQYVIDQMRALCAMIHEVDPAIPIYSSTWRHLPDWDGSLDVWGIGNDGRVPVEEMDQLRAGGAKIWFTTDGLQCLDTPYCAIERLLPHYCFKYHALAYEFWGVSWHTYDPYQWGWHSYIPQSDEPGADYFVRYPNGDGYLIYPSREAAGPPVPSIRLEQAREGVEDYEYLRRLQSVIEQAGALGIDTSAGQSALVEAADLIAIPNAGGRYSSKLLSDPDAVLQTRRALGNAIESLSQRLRQSGASVD